MLSNIVGIVNLWGAHMDVFYVNESFPIFQNLVTVLAIP